ncbi:MAG TPA: tetratricopeptide repeat protein [Pseudonocardiaceae bacterium]
MPELTAERRITLLRRTYRHDDTAVLIDELLGTSAEAEVEHGRIAMMREQWAVALGRFDAALKLDANLEPAHAWRVAALSCLRRYDEARSAAAEALTAHPEHHLVRVALARVAIDEAGDRTAALAELEPVLAAAPDHLEALEQSVYTLTGLGRLDEALALADAAASMYPDAAELQLAAGYPLEMMARFPDAVARAERAVALDPHHVRAHSGLAGRLMGAARSTDASALLGHALGVMPHAAPLHAAHGEVLFAAGDLSAALDRYRTACALEPDVAIYHDNHAYVLAVLGRTTESVAVIDAAMRRLPADIGLLHRLAWRHVEHKAFDAAAELALRAHGRAPRTPDEVLASVKLLRVCRRFREAEKLLTGVLDADPEHAVAIHQMAWVLADQDRDEDACTWFRRAAGLQPNRLMFVGDLITCLGWLGRLEDAEKVARDACARMPDSVYVRRRLGNTLQWQGRHQEALELFEEATRTHPDYVDGWEAAISLLRQLRRFSEADGLVTRALRRHPAADDLWLQQVWLRRDRGDFEGAIDAARRGIGEVGQGRHLSHLLADLLRDTDRPEEAMKVLGGLTDNADTRYETTELLRHLRRYDDAFALARSSLAEHPGDVRFPLVIGDMSLDIGRPDDALASYEDATRLSPDSRAALGGRSIALRRLRRFDEAERLLVEYLAERPNYAGIGMKLGGLLEDLGRWDEAIAVYDRMLAVHRRDVDLLWSKGNALRLMGRLDEAESVLRQGLEIEPYDSSLLTELGELHDDRNEYEEALGWFDRALEVAPRSSWALVARSATLRSLGRFSEALDMLAPALARRPVDPDLLIEQGWVHRDARRWKPAERSFVAAAEATVNPGKRAETLRGRGWVAFSRDDHDEALRHFRAALTEDAYSADAKLGLAWTLVRQGEPNGEAEAEKLCHDVLTEEPRSHLAHTCLGVLASQQGDLRQAEYHLRRSIELDPYDGSYVDLGALFVQMDRLDEAEELLTKAVERDWYDGQAHIELGGLYLQRGFEGDPASTDGTDAQRAVRHFRQALVIEPASGSAAIGLALALAKSPPADLVAAERVLRQALARSDCDQPKWQLLVALARLLIERGDATQRRDLHLEALNAAQQAIELAADQADPYYVAGVAAYKAGETGPEVQARPFHLRRSLRYLRNCLRCDPEHAEARRVMTLAEQSLTITRTGLAGSVAIMGLAGALLVALWVGFFLTDKVTTVVISTLTPILIGLVAVGFVLPFLVRLKLPGGVEADLSASLSQVSSGPTGEVTMGPGRLVGRGFDGTAARPPLGGGPRGELSRLG